MLALGICASVAIFVFVDASLLKPLPYKNPARLIGAFRDRRKLPSLSAPCTPTISIGRKTTNPSALSTSSRMPASPSRLAPVQCPPVVHASATVSSRPSESVPRWAVISIRVKTCRPRSARPILAWATWAVVVWRQARNPWPDRRAQWRCLHHHRCAARAVPLRARRTFRILGRDSRHERM